MNNSFLPVEVKEVPSKSEIDYSLAVFIENPAIPAAEKYAVLKGMEYAIKTGIDKLKKPAIEDFLKTYNGAVKYNVLGTEMQVTAERKDTTRKKYTYSDTVTEIEHSIFEAEAGLAILRDTLKLQQSIEINNGTAKMDIITEMADPVYGIKVTLRK